MQFENLIIWKEARELFLEIYILCKKTVHKDYYFRSQILDATLSISNNIAEGFERRTINELRRFFDIAKGSCGEVRSMIHLGKDIGYLNDAQYEFLLNKTRKLGILIYRYTNKTLAPS